MFFGSSAKDACPFCFPRVEQEVGMEEDLVEAGRQAGTCIRQGLRCTDVARDLQLASYLHKRGQRGALFLRQLKATLDLFPHIKVQIVVLRRRLGLLSLRRIRSKIQRDTR